MQLLEDVFIIENLQVLNEGSKNGPMRIRGCFQRADEENNNKRIYSKSLLEREMGKLSEAISERRLMGELDHPQHDSVKLSNASHLITGLSMKGNEVIGEAEILDTPSGKVAKALISGGVKVGVSSRGMGTVSEDIDGKRHVNEDFKLITWDLVADPSTRGAYPGLTESTQIQEIIDRVYPEAQKVKNFTTLLKESLDGGFLVEKRSRGEGSSGRVSGSHNQPVKYGTTKTRVTARRKREGQEWESRREYREREKEARKTLGTIGLGREKGSKNRPLKILKTNETPNEESSLNFIKFMRSRLNEMCRTCTNKAKRAAKKTFKKGGDATAQKREYIRTMRDEGHKRHGKPGETPRQTQVRRHGGTGGVPS